MMRKPGFRLLVVSHEKLKMFCKFASIRHFGWFTYILLLYKLNKIMCWALMNSINHQALNGNWTETLMVMCSRCHGKSRSLRPTPLSEAIMQCVVVLSPRVQLSFQYMLIVIYFLFSSTVRYILSLQMNRITTVFLQHQILGFAWEVNIFPQGYLISYNRISSGILFNSHN